MKVSYPVKCRECGFDFPATGYADREFPPATCPKCEKQVHLLDRLSISVVSDRLLQRSRNEIDTGDYTVSIICSAMAVECALTQVFFKWKRMARKSPSSWITTQQERETWEREYKRGTGRGGFENSANFVSEFLCGKRFDDFTSAFYRDHSAGVLVASGFPADEAQSRVRFINEELFRKRNRIMHWGTVNYQKEDASLALSAGCTSVNILKAIDKEMGEAMESKWLDDRNKRVVTESS